MVLPTKARSPLSVLEAWPTTVAARARQGIGCGWLVAAFLAGLLLGQQLERTKEPSGALPSAVELAPERAPARNTPPPVPAVAGETAIYNLKTHKYHCPSCRSARACTANCVELPLEEAQRRGIPCGNCGGRC